MSAFRTASSDHPNPAVLGTPWALTSLALTMLLSSLGTSIANVGLPALARAFDSSFQAVQWVVLSYLLAVTALVVSAGRLGDLIGRRRLLLAGIGGFTAASLACAGVDNLGWLIAARAVQGAGAALMLALSMALVSETVSKQRVGSAMGLLGTMSAVGTALGPSVGGVLIEAFGWQAIFLINAPLGLIALALAHRFLPRDCATTGRIAFDAVGSGLLTLALIACALAMTWGRGDFGLVNLALLFIAGLMLRMFVIVESRTAAPLLQPALFRSRVMRTGFVTSVLATTVAMSTLVIGPFYLTAALHLSVAKTGMAMAAGPLVAALVGVPAGRGVDRWGSRRMIILGLAAMMLGSAALSLVWTELGIFGYVVPLVVLTAGFATFQAANNSAVLALTDAAQRGVVSGLLNLSRNLGLIAGAAAMGAVFAWFAGVVSIANADIHSVVAGTRAVFVVATALIASALVVTIAGERR